MIFLLKSKFFLLKRNQDFPFPMRGLIHPAPNPAWPQPQVPVSHSLLRGVNLRQIFPNPQLWGEPGGFVASQSFAFPFQALPQFLLSSFPRAPCAGIGWNPLHAGLEMWQCRREGQQWLLWALSCPCSLERRIPFPAGPLGPFSTLQEVLIPPELHSTPFDRDAVIVKILPCTKLEYREMWGFSSQLQTASSGSRSAPRADSKS